MKKIARIISVISIVAVLSGFGVTAANATTEVNCGVGPSIVSLAKTNGTFRCYTGSGSYTALVDSVRNVAGGSWNGRVYSNGRWISFYKNTVTGINGDVITVQIY